MSNVIVDPFALEVGGPDPTITFTWDPVNGTTLPSGTFARASIKQEYDGTDFTELSSGSIPENSAAVTSGAKGFHPEPSATNQMPTVALDDAAWTKLEIIVTDNGTNVLGLNEYDLDAGTNLQFHRISDNASTSGAGSAYFITKELAGRYMTVLRGATASVDYACYDLQTGTITEEGADIDEALITDIGNGFYKCEMNTSDTSANLFLSISDTGTPGDAFPTFTGANETILSCHAQYENTIFSTSPIITSGSTLTRQADVLDTDVTITAAFSAVLDLTLPAVIGTGNTISLLGPDATSEDILRVDDTGAVIMDDGGTPVTIGTATLGTRIKVAYGRDGTGRSGSLDGATAVTGGAPGSGHEGDSFQLGCANSVNQSRSIHHESTLFNVRKSDAELEALSS